MPLAATVPLFRVQAAEPARFQAPNLVDISPTLTARHTVRFHRPRRPTLTLADLTGGALKRLGLNNDVCATDD